jgi:hypothetical protein
LVREASAVEAAPVLHSAVTEVLAAMVLPALAEEAAPEDLADSAFVCTKLGLRIQVSSGPFM